MTERELEFNSITNYLLVNFPDELSEYGAYETIKHLLNELKEKRNSDKTTRDLINEWVRNNQ